MPFNTSPSSPICQCTAVTTIALSARRVYIRDSLLSSEVQQSHRVGLSFTFGIPYHLWKYDNRNSRTTASQSGSILAFGNTTIGTRARKLHSRDPLSPLETQQSHLADLNFTKQDRSSRLESQQSHFEHFLFTFPLGILQTHSPSLSSRHSRSKSPQTLRFRETHTLLLLPIYKLSNLSCVRKFSWLTVHNARRFCIHLQFLNSPFSDCECRRSAILYSIESGTVTPSHSGTRK